MKQWHSIHEEQIEEFAKVVVEKILDNLNDRSGFDTGNSDDDVLDEMRYDFRNIVVSTLKKMGK